MGDREGCKECLDAVDLLIIRMGGTMQQVRENGKRKIERENKRDSLSERALSVE